MSALSSVRLLVAPLLLCALVSATAPECLGVPDGGAIRIAIDPYAASNFTKFVSTVLSNQSAAPAVCDESSFPLGLSFPWYIQACKDSQLLLSSALVTVSAFPAAFREYVRVSKTLLPGLNESSFSLKADACATGVNASTQAELAKETLTYVASLMNITTGLLNDLKNATSFGDDVTEAYSDMRSAMYITDYTYLNSTLWNCTLSLNNTVSYPITTSPCTQAYADMASQANQNLTAIDNFNSQWNFEGVMRGVARFQSELNVIVKDVAKQQYNFNYTTNVLNRVLANATAFEGCMYLGGVAGMLQFEISVVDAYWAFLCKFGFV